jgi:redox-sensitive bicupin YhaK (pirin superfamily)
VPAFPGTVYVDVTLPPGASIDLPVLAPELALYPVEGEVRVADQAIRPGNMAVLEPQPVTLASAAGARLVLIGGEPLDGPRHLWWNFVSSSRERILQASADWQAQRMGQVPGDPEFIPLPPTRFTPPEPMS